MTIFMRALTLAAELHLFLHKVDIVSRVKNKISVAGLRKGGYRQSILQYGHVSESG